MNQLLQEIDKIFYDYVQYLIDCYILYYDSIDNYHSRKEPSKYRKIMFYLTFVLITSVIVKYGLLLIYPDKLMWTPLKDCTMVFGDQAILIHALSFSFLLVTIIGKLIFLFHETKFEIKLFDIIVAIKARDQNYILSQKHFKKIKFMTSFLYYGFVRIIGFIILFIFSLTITGLTIISYQHYDYGNVIVLCFWSVLFIYLGNQVRVTLMTHTVFSYITIFLLNYKFDELIEKLRVSIRWNNENNFDKILVSYDKLTVVVKQLSGQFNMIIGVVYCYCPYVIAINMELVKIKQDDILSTVVETFFIILLIISNITAFLINQISASISVRNKLFPRYLYPVFFWKRKTNIRMELKIDSFISRLNSQFVGFYCFTWFKFTKMAFYQYAFTLSSSYILISNIFSK